MRCDDIMSNDALSCNVMRCDAMRCIVVPCDVILLELWIHACHKPSYYCLSVRASHHAHYSAFFLLYHCRYWSLQCLAVRYCRFSLRLVSSNTTVPYPSFTPLTLTLSSLSSLLTTWNLSHTSLLYPYPSLSPLSLTLTLTSLILALTLTSLSHFISLPLILSHPIPTSLLLPLPLPHPVDSPPSDPWDIGTNWDDFVLD